jgi:hypothetical protein
MLVHDYDDEQTLAEEEALAIAGGEDPQNELNSLQKVILLLLCLIKPIIGGYQLD